MKHTCHAKGCNVEVAPKLLMCIRHWRMVPKTLQAAIWRHYRPGQEIDKQPSEAYLVTQRAAVAAVAAKEAARE